MRCCAAAFSVSSSASSCADPRCLIWRAPRREDHTTCSTAVAPDVVFTVRMYGTRPLYEPGPVRKFSFSHQQPRRSQSSLSWLAISAVRARAMPRTCWFPVRAG